MILLNLSTLCYYLNLYSFEIKEYQSFTSCQTNSSCEGPIDIIVVTQGVKGFMCCTYARMPFPKEDESERH